MKKNIIFLGLLLLVIPGCFYMKTPVRRRYPVAVETEVPYTETVVRPSPDMVQESEEQVPFREEEIQGFSLEEPESAFAAPAEIPQAPALPAERQEQEVIDESWVDKRLDQAQEHGFRPVYFGFDEYTIKPDQKAALDYNLRKIAGLVRKGAVVVVEGHACRFAGSAVYNMMLSEKRAESVAAYLVEQGIPRDRLKVVGRGYEMCVVPEGDKEQQAPNRRVEFYVVPEQVEAQVPKIPAPQPLPEQEAPAKPATEVIIEQPQVPVGELMVEQPSAAAEEAGPAQLEEELEQLGETDLSDEERAALEQGFDFEDELEELPEQEM
jgi:outer membrane protein OmpA-like peptidoglycan-associated protein